MGGRAAEAESRRKSPSGLPSRQPMSACLHSPRRETGALPEASASKWYQGLHHTHGRILRGQAAGKAGFKVTEPVGKLADGDADPSNPIFHCEWLLWLGLQGRQCRQAAFADHPSPVFHSRLPDVAPTDCQEGGN